MTTAEVTGKCTLFEGCKVSQVKNKQGTRGQDTRQFGGETYSNYPIPSPFSQPVNRNYNNSNYQQTNRPSGSSN